jgi:hypothetical protein
MPHRILRRSHIGIANKYGTKPVPEHPCLELFEP